MNYGLSIVVLLLAVWVPDKSQYNQKNVLLREGTIQTQRESTALNKQPQSKHTFTLLVKGKLDIHCT